MGRPKADDPSVPLPVRIPQSLLDRLRADADDVGKPLAVRVRELLAAGLVLLERIEPSDPAPSAPSAPIPPPQPGRPRLDLLERREKTEHVDLRPGALTCECATPTISKAAPVCTTCHRRRR